MPVTSAMQMTPMQLALLEKTVAAYYRGSQAQIADAERALDQYRLLPRPYTLLQQLIDGNASTQTVLWAIALVEQWLSGSEHGRGARSWRALTSDGRKACSSVLVGLVVASAKGGGDKTVAEKLQHLLAIVLRSNWPADWEGFIPDLIGAAGVHDDEKARTLLLLASHPAPADRRVALRSGGRSG
eukprot:4507169-Prymnesium_polylepis.1